MLLGAALFFWGWQVGLFPLAVLLACGLEASWLTRARWDFSQADLNRIWKLCTFLFLGCVAMALLSDQGLGLLDNAPLTRSSNQRLVGLNKGAKSVLLFFQWLPIAFYPIVVAQAFGQSRTMSLATFSWVFRRRAAERPHVPPPSLNVSYPYFGLLMLAASATTAHPESFYWMMAFLLVWGLWAQRVRRFAPALAGAIILLICFGGYAGNSGLRELQRLAVAFDTAFMSRFAGRDFDHLRHRSLLGSVGRIKKSGSIVMWVKTKDVALPPPLLREASYDQFTSPVWHVSRKDFSITPSEGDQTTWKLLENRNAWSSVHVSRLLPGGRGLLAVPNGTIQLDNLPVFLLRTNTLGVLQVQGPGLVSYDAHFSRKSALDGPPTEEDTRVPPREAPVITQIANQLGLPNLGIQHPRRTVEAVEKYFADNFSYTTYLEPPPPRRSRRSDRTNRTEVARFLLETRKGHCEYFASATVLLLRRAGIPARYAVGYSVQEGSAGKYVVRDRHAHSWCLAYLNGGWVDVDTTPASWNAAEAMRAPWWEPLNDAWARVRFQIARLRWSSTNLRKYFLWLLAPMSIVLAGLIYRRRQWVRRKFGPAVPLVVPGADSEFYLIERRLRELGFDRKENEPLGAWLRRVNGSAPRDGVPLESLLALHYRYRFDPAGLASAERKLLREDARKWLVSTALGSGERRRSTAELN
jgi:protein-glutamine gamma-glutamyltransferase